MIKKDENLQSFGSAWTVAKLEILEEYLQAYIKIMKNQKFKLCYIDTFAGSGSIVLKNSKDIDGSATRALKYPFDRYRFFEKDKLFAEQLRQRTAEYELSKDIKIYNADCNEHLMKINSYNWIKNNWRGVISLDPYAMDLSWECLIEISKTKAFDVWYLFPFMAVNRNLYKIAKDIPETNRDRLNRVFGSNDWETELYKESDQINMFSYEDLHKQGTGDLRTYILNKLKSVFPAVSDNAVLLKNEKNSPVFLLCFAGSNPGSAAKATALRVANHLLKNIEKPR